jgi:hypothetical protein
MNNLYRVITLFSIVLLVPYYLQAQQLLAKRYVDDRINELTHLYFNADGTFEFHYLYDLAGDEGSGRYTLHKDTLLLSFNSDAVREYPFVESAVGVRADSLLIKGHMIYVIKNGRSREFEPQDSVHHRPPKNERWKYRRRYLLFGYWYTHWSRYYMVDERYAKWASHKWLKEHKSLFD